MAESYRGLTIRIGGDTSKLQKALNTANSAAAGAQQELRKLGQALKIDPSNVEAYNLQLGYMGDKATATAMKLYQLQQAAKQVSQQRVELKTKDDEEGMERYSESIADLAQNTKNAHMEAAQAKAEYNKVKDSLSGMYQAITKYNQQAAELFNENIGKKLAESISVSSTDDAVKQFLNDLKNSLEGFEGVVDIPLTLGDDEKLKEELDDIADKLKKIHDEYMQTNGEVRKGELQKEFEKIVKSYTELSGLEIRYAEGTTGKNQVKQTLDSLEQLRKYAEDGGATDIPLFNTQVIEAARNEINRLRAAYVDAFNELQKANEVARFADLRVEAINTEASVKAIADALADMRVPTELMRSMTALSTYADELAREYDELAKAGKAAESAYSINPSNEEALTSAMNSYAEAERVAIERLDTLQQKQEKFDTTEIDQYVDSTRSLESQLLDAAAAHSKAEQTLSVMEGAIESTRHNLNMLVDDANDMTKVFDLDIGGKSVQELIAALADGDGALKEFREAVGKGATGINEFAAALMNEIQKGDEYNEWLNGLITLLGSFSAAAEKSGDISLGERLKGGMNDLLNYTAAVNALADARAEAEQKKNTEDILKNAKAYRENAAEMAEVTGKIDEMRVAQQKLAAGDIELHVDTTGLDELKDAQKQIADGGSSVSQAFSSIANDIEVLGPLMQAAAKRAEELFGAFKADPTNAEALELAMNSLSEAMAGSVMRAEQLRDIISKYSAEDIDEVAIATNTVGINAERAAEEAAGLARQTDEAKKAYEALLKQRAEALKSAEGNTGGANNAGITELNRQIDEAKAKYDGLIASAERATKAMNVATATQELVHYREELAMVEQQQRRMAESIARTASQSAVVEVAGDTSSIERLGKQLDAAVTRANALQRAVELRPDDIELTTAKTKAFEDVAELTRLRIEAIQGAVSDIDPSEIEDLRSRFGTVSNAVDATMESFVGLQTQLTQTEAELDSLGDSDEAGLNRLIKRVDDLRAALAKAREEMGKAAIAEFAENADKLIAETIAKSQIKTNIKIDLDDSASQKLKSLAEDLKNLKFDGTGVDGLIQRFNLAEDSVKQTKDNFDKLKSALKDSPKDGALLNQTLDSAKQYANALRAQIAAGSAALEGWDKSKIDMVAIAMGTVGANLKKAQQDFDRTQAEVEELEKKLQKAEQALADMGSAKTDEAEAEVRQLSDALDEAKRDAEAAADALDRATQTKRYSDINVGVSVSNAELDTVTGQIDAKSFDVTPKVDEAAFQQVMGRIAQYAQQAGQQIVESANTIDVAYRDMRKTVIGTEEDFEAIRSEAIKFSQTHFTSADSILEMEALGGQLGITTEKLRDGRTALQAFGETASNLDIATNIPAEEIALKLGQITNVMSDLNFDTFDNFADALVRLGNNMPTTESAIMDIAQRMASVANVTSMTTPQLLAWSAAIASTGQHSESAATAITKTITGIGDAVSAGGDKLAAFASIANMTADKFEEAWANSSSEALEAFVRGLSTLTDDSTAAIEALDSVGISSVRQETALLSLTQTVDNLGNAMTMSGDAFNGVSDQWGQAGDAAREAQNKSEGFSGSLAILQNNASNLAASLGDGLIPAMDLLSSALAVITDFLNGLPAPLKAATVTVGGATVAIGLLDAATREMQKDWISMTAKLAESPEDFGMVKKAIVGAGNAVLDIVKSLKGIPVAVAEANAGGATMSGTFAAIGTGAAGAAAGVASLVTALAPLAAVAAVVTAIIAVKAAYDEWREHVELVEKATTGLTDSLKAAEAEYDSYAQAAASAAKSVQEITDSTDELIEKQASLADAMNQKWEDFGTNAALVRAYADEIDELTQKASLNREEQARLTAAVQGYNEITGQSVSVIDVETGKLNESTDSILKNADAWERRAKSEVAYEMYKDALRSRIEAETQRNEVYAKMQKEEQAYQDELKRTGEQQDSIAQKTGYMGYAYSEHAGEVARLKAKYDELTDLMKSADSSMAGLTGYMMVGTEQVAELTSALADAGFSMEDFAGVTDEELAEVASSYGNNIDEAIRKLKELAAAHASTAVTAEASVSVEVVKPSDDEYEAYKDGLDKLYTEEKRLRDDFYEGEKLARDHAYSAAKAQMDAEQESYKRMLDDEYEARKRELDAVYSARKDELDNEYNITKKAYDKEYDARKEVLDNEYDIAKETYDKEYDARKEVLDKEYDAAKKASDKYLKNLKDEQSQAVETFKKATDARIDDMKREYEQKKALIESETKADTSDVDARIQALKDEAQAEKDAETQRTRQEKIDELTDSVNRAKTKKKRADAERELNDYVSSIEKENQERSREDMIAALEKEKDAIEDAASKRQDILKSSYDTAVESYKASREQQLEVLTKANEAEYERAKELEESKLQLQKDANQAELDKMKSDAEAALEIKKSENDAELEGLKEYHETLLDAKKSENDAELQQLKLANEDVLKELERRHEDDLNLRKSANELALQDLEERQARELELLKRGHEDELNEIKDLNGRKAEAYKEGGQAAVDALMASIEAANQAQSAVNDVAQEVVTNAANSLNAVPQAAQNAMQVTLGAISGAVPSISTASAGIANVVGSALDTLPEKAKASIEGYVTWLSEGLTSSEPAVRQKFEDFVSGLGGSLKGLEDAAEQVGVNVPTVLHDKIAENADKPSQAVGVTRDNIIKSLSGLKESFESSGNKAIVGWNNSFVKGANTALENVTKWANNVISTVMKTHQINSPSRKFAWMAEMDLSGFTQGWESSAEGAYRAVGDTADRLLEAFDMGSLDSDPMRDVLERMRAHERDLEAEANRMSEIVERGFDPKLTVDAAFEAMGRIDRGELARQQAVMSPTQQQAASNVITVNNDFTGVVVSDESYIERLSEEFERRMRRILNSQIG